MKKQKALLSLSLALICTFAPTSFAAKTKKATKIKTTTKTNKIEKTKATPVAKSYKVNLNSNGKTDFLAIGRPSALKIRGKGKTPNGNLEIKAGKLSGELNVTLNDFDTGMKLRNKHMRKKYLETDKYPKAVVKLNPIEVPDADFDKTLAFTATLQLHGVEKPINGEIKLKRQNKNLAIDAKFKFKITDFAIKIPSFAGVTVANEVEIESNCNGELSPL